MKRTFTFFFFLYILCTFSSYAIIIRVNASASGIGADGTTWGTAYPNLQTALGIATSGDQIWVAAGVYIPGGFATASFTIPSGVSVYGGFAGGEGTLSARNVTTNVTSLSGNGVCNHVVTFNNVSAPTLLDGFTIAGGSGGTFITGGGIYNIGGGTNVTVQNCIIRNNKVYQGGGMYNLGIPNASNPTVTNCSFLSNTATYQGGGVMNYAPEGTAGGTYTTCIFDGNEAGQGRAFFNAVEKGASTLSFTNCTFKNHSGYAFDNYGRGANISASTSATATTSISFSVCSFSANASGAIFNNTYNNPNNNTFSVRSCTVTESGYAAVNLYSQGGKCTATVTDSYFHKNGDRTVYMDGSNSGQCNGTFTNCRFTENTGSGLYSYGQYSGQSNQTVTNCVFSKNSGGDAAMYNHGSSGQAIAAVSSCSFVENTGGALYNYQNFKGTTRPTFDNCLFLSNTNSYGGAAVYNNGEGTRYPSFTNCRFLDNTSSGTGGAIYNYFSSFTSTDQYNTLISSCTFTGNRAGSYGGGAMYNNFNGSGVASMSITNCTVNSNTATASNSEGGGMVNYINSSTSGTLTVANSTFNDNWASRAGGGVVNNGKALFVAYTNCTFNRNRLTDLTAYQGGGGVYNGGGFGGSGTLTFTDCQINDNTATAFGGGVVNNNSFSGGTYAISYVRCTINNNKTAGTNASSNYGGGMTNFGMGSYPIVTDCSISNNTANTQASGYAEGGGVYNNNSFPTFTNCVINSNVGRNGGGVHNMSASSSTQSTSLINCTISGNSATGTGGHMDSDGGDGGGIYNGNSKIALINCLVSGNKATDEGGGLLVGYSTGPDNTATLLNSTVSGNNAYAGGGIFYNTSPLIITNSLIWGNSTGIDGYHDASTITYSSIESLTAAPGSNNLDGTLPTSNPLFVSQPAFSSAPTTAGNFRLTSCSPAINAGNPSSQTVSSGPYNSVALPATDLASSARLFDSRVDMGAFEFQGVRTALTITQQPASVSVCQNNSVTIPVTANGPITAYQFYVNGTLTGSPQGSPSLSNVQPAQAGNYSMVVTGICNSVTSTAFTVTVNPAPQPSVFATTGNGTLQLQIMGGIGYEQIKAIERFNGYLIRATETNTTGYFVIDRPGPYTITVIGGNGCRTNVNGSL